MRKNNKPIVVPERPDVVEAKKLPPPMPGVPVDVPLMLLPTYLNIHDRKPNGYREAHNVLLVKKS
jgi:hypothetical protein